MIRLTAVIDGEGQAPRALTFESNARTLVLGRDASADFQLPLATISRHHARIFENDNIYVIEDLGSTHGTQVNGKPVGQGEKKVLHTGDVIDLTRAKITCAIESEKVASVDPHESTQAVAARAVQGILGRLGDAKQSAPYLRALTGSMAGTRYPLTGPQGSWTIGRSHDCECMIDDANVSRRHATLKKDWSGFVVEDLGSKNGVLIGETRVRRRQRLKNGDELTIGPIKLVFVDPDADLLDALRHVPGFEVEDAQDIDEPEPEPRAAAADAPDLLGAAGEGPDAAEPEEEEDELADLDPSLLEPPVARARMDWAIVGGAVALAGLAGLALYFIL